MITKALEYAAELRRTYPGTCIAGGAARDTILGKEIKDYDIFVPVNRQNLIHDSVTLARKYPEAISTNQAYAGYDGRPEFLGALHIPEHKIDIVLFDWMQGYIPEQIVRTFDNSLSRAWFDESGSVVTTPEFDRAIEQRLIETYQAIPTRVSHLLRIARKYPDFDWALNQ